MSDKTNEQARGEQARSQFWRERAEGYERRINGFIAQVNTALGENAPQCSTLEDCQATIEQYIGAELAGSDRRLNTLRAYLWATLALVPGKSVVIGDTLLLQAMGGELRISAPRDGSQTTIEAVAEAEQQPSPTIVQPERKIILPGGGAC